jgi:hypothetical protein
MRSLRSFLGVPFYAFCVLVTTALAERVVLLDDTFVAFEQSRAFVEVNVPPFVLGGNLPPSIHSVVAILSLSRNASPCHCLPSR